LGVKSARTLAGVKATMQQATKENCAANLILKAIIVFSN